MIGPQQGKCTRCISIGAGGVEPERACSVTGCRLPLLKNTKSRPAQCSSGDVDIPETRAYNRLRYTTDPLDLATHSARLAQRSLSKGAPAGSAATTPALSTPAAEPHSSVPQTAEMARPDRPYTPGSRGRQRTRSKAAPAGSDPAAWAAPFSRPGHRMLAAAPHVAKPLTHSERPRCLEVHLHMARASGNSPWMCHQPHNAPPPIAAPRKNRAEHNEAG